MKILVINGPNLNLLGQRDKKYYGTITLEKINQKLQEIAQELELELEFFQSNHEGGIIDYLQLPSSRAADGILVNPGALVRYAYCFRAALLDHGKPVVEVHMADINQVGINKQVNVLDDVSKIRVMGKKEKSYYEGLRELVKYLRG